MNVQAFKSQENCFLNNLGNVEVNNKVVDNFKYANIRILYIVMCGAFKDMFRRILVIKIENVNI